MFVPQLSGLGPMCCNMCFPVCVCAGVQVRLESVHVETASGNVCARIFGFRA